MFNRSKKVAKQFDWQLLIVTIFLCIYGLIVLYSASGQSMGYMKSQTIATLLGFGIIVILQFVDMDMVQKLSVPIYIISIGLLVLTLLIGFGGDDWGAKSWIKIGPVRFQPSEVVKIGVMLSFSAALDHFKKSINKPHILIALGVIALVPVFLLMKQPDFGTSAVFLFFMALMLFYSGLHWGYIVGAIAFLVIAAPIAYTRLDSFQQERILDFLNPARDPLGSGYQGLQGLIAIGSGQFLGRGYLQGTQSQLGFIPEESTDYIFSVLVEELGFVGGVVLILAYTFFLYRILIIASHAKNIYGKSICIGVAAMIFVHVFENIGMLIGLMPVTGIPLPFMSYGGTFQLICLISIGLVLSVSTQRNPLDFNI